MTDLTAIIAAHPLYHDEDEPNDVCACGWFIDSEALDYSGDTPGQIARLHAAHVAAAIREARTIATVEQLDALPVGTIIRDQDDEGLTRVGDGWACAGPFSPYPSSSVLEGGASATVLYRPDEDGE